jgi:hypothetical protein
MCICTDGTCGHCDYCTEFRSNIRKYTSPNTPEPPPVPNPAAPAIWDLVMADMQERDSTGARKYGQRLTGGDGRNSLIDAYQEVLDTAVYLRKAIWEQTGK